MGYIYGDFTLVNPFNKRSVDIHALVDTGSTHAYVTEDVARQLGFDVQEVSRRTIILADGSRKEVPAISPLQIRFADRECHTDAFVVADECLIGVIPLESMFLALDPDTGKVLLGAPRPEGPRFKRPGGW